MTKEDFEEVIAKQQEFHDFKIFVSEQVTPYLEGGTIIRQAKRREIEAAENFEVLEMVWGKIQDAYKIKLPSLKQLEKDFGANAIEETDNSEKTLVEQVISDQQLCQMSIEKTKYLVQDYIPENSIILVAGKRANFKSFFAHHVAVAVAGAVPALQTQQTRKAKVLYVDKENNLSLIQARHMLVRNGLCISGTIDFGVLEGTNLTLDEDLSITAWKPLLEKLQPSLIVIDSLSRCMLNDENDVRTVNGMFLKTLQPIARDYNCSLLIIHHNRKGFGRFQGDDMEEVRGSSDLSGMADIVLMLDRIKRTNKVQLKMLKNRYGNEVEPIMLRFDFSDLTGLTVTNEGTILQELNKVVEMATRILEWCSKEQKMEFKPSMLKELGSRTTITDAIGTLLSSGKILKVGYGKYQVVGVR